MIVYSEDADHWRAFLRNSREKERGAAPYAIDAAPLNSIPVPVAGLLQTAFRSPWGAIR